MDTLSDPQTAFETTGTLSRESGVSKATGQPLGATGSARSPKTYEAALEATG